MTTRPPTTPATSPASTWALDLATAMRLLRRPGEVLCPPPAGTPLDQLVQVWLQWLPQPGDLNPIATACSRWSPYFADRDGYAELLTNLLRNVENSIADRLDAGEQHPELIRTADLDVRTIVSHFRFNGDPVVLAAGRVLGDARALPQATGLQEEDCPTFDGLRWLIMGPLHLDKRPRVFYLVSEAEKLTRAVKHRQDQEAAEQAEADRQERLNERRRIEQDENVKLARALARLKRLEQAGKIPPEDPALDLGPAVRVAQPSDRPARTE
jgi:hypothetical protein